MAPRAGRVVCQVLSRSPRGSYSLEDPRLSLQAAQAGAYEVLAVGHQRSPPPHVARVVGVELQPYGGV
jgi:hypothetical protein